VSIASHIPAGFSGDRRSLAEQIIYMLLDADNPEALVKALTPAVEEEIRSVLRDRARAAEKEIDTALARPPRVVGKNWRPAIDRRSAFLHSMFSTGDGKPPVSWGAATIEQHRRRIALLERNIAGINTTISRHEMAVAAITQAGVTCLNELPELPEDLK